MESKESLEPVVAHLLKRRGGHVRASLGNSAHWAVVGPLQLPDLAWKGINPLRPMYRRAIPLEYPPPVVSFVFPADRVDLFVVVLQEFKKGGQSVG
jgi:hypothetical protein